MTRLYSLALICGFALPAFAADDKSEKKEDDKPKLAIGDPAPPIKPTKWLQGAEVNAFELGKVYVVEFWATWCGPCIVMMPHMSNLQDEYRSKGVTFIGFSSKDNNNGEAKVIDFVEKRGKRLHYTLAFEDNRETNEAYMKAAGRNGIPCCFVVDKAGKIAFIGHPMLLDDVLPKVVAGTWKGKEDTAEVEKSLDDYRDVAKLGFKDAEAGVKAFDEFRAKHPNLAKGVFIAPLKLSFLMKLEKYSDAKAEAEQLAADAVKHEDGAVLGRVASTLVGKGNAELKALAVKVAENAYKLNGDSDLSSVLVLADAHFAAGDKEKAKAFGAKAVQVADPKFKKSIEERVKKYDGDEKKDETKKDQ